jgi:hypothetical protein
MERVEGCEEGRVSGMAQRVWCFRKGLRVGLNYLIVVTELVSQSAPKDPSGAKLLRP